MYDEKFIGKQQGIAYGNHGARAAYASIAAGRYANYCGNAVAVWTDPDF